MAVVQFVIPAIGKVILEFLFELSAESRNVASPLGTLRIDVMQHEPFVALAKDQ